MEPQQAIGKGEKQDDDRMIQLEGEEAQYFNWLIGEATEEERLNACREFYQDGFEFYISDPETGAIVFGSRPLMRAFVLSKKETGDPETQPEKVLSAIEECIESFHGMAREDDTDDDSEGNDRRMWEIGFQKGFGNYGCVVGLFFSSESREAATQEILSQWGACGVLTQITAAEFRELQERRNFCRNNFNEDEFRSRFDGMTHDERLGEIKELWRRGNEFEISDPSSGTHYSSVGAKSTFCIDYSLGFKPKFLQPAWLSSQHDAMSIKELMRIEEDTESRMRTIVQIELAIQELVRERGGEVETIGRMIEEDEDGELCCDTGGCTMIECRFPNKSIRDQVMNEVLEGWEMFEVSVDPESRQLTLEDKIEEAVLNAARFEGDPERRQQLLSKKGPVFQELKKQIINEEIANKESTQEENDN